MAVSRLVDEPDQYIEVFAVSLIRLVFVLIAPSRLVDDVTRLPPIPLLMRLAIAASTLTEESDILFEVVSMLANAVSVDAELVLRLRLVFCVVVIAAFDAARALSTDIEDILRFVLDVLRPAIKFV
jgi:hypothetical protein